MVQLNAFVIQSSIPFWRWMKTVKFKHYKVESQTGTENM